MERNHVLCHMLISAIHCFGRMDLRGRAGGAGRRPESLRRSAKGVLALVPFLLELDVALAKAGLSVWNATETKCLFDSHDAAKHPCIRCRENQHNVSGLIRLDH